MSGGYLSKDRDHLNRQQRKRRARLVRIDYMPDAEALAVIDAKRPPFGIDSTNSAVLNAILREWADLSGIKKRKVERPKTSGVAARIPPAPVRANDFRLAGATFEPLTRAPAPETPGIYQPVLRARITPAANPLARVTCGAARRRDGEPCQALSVPGKRRCKWHGGCSTVPKTSEGEARALANLKRGGD